MTKISRLQYLQHDLYKKKNPINQSFHHLYVLPHWSFLPFLCPFNIQFSSLHGSRNRKLTIESCFVVVCLFVPKQYLSGARTLSNTFGTLADKCF